MKIDLDKLKIEQEKRDIDILNIRKFVEERRKRFIPLSD